MQVVLIILVIVLCIAIFIASLRSFWFSRIVSLAGCIAVGVFSWLAANDESYLMWVGIIFAIALFYFFSPMLFETEITEEVFLFAGFIIECREEHPYMTVGCLLGASGIFGIIAYQVAESWILGGVCCAVLLAILNIAVIIEKCKED